MPITFLFSFIFSQSIQISVDNNQIEEGDLINLSVEAIGSKDFPQVDLTVLKPTFEILGGPSQQTNIQFIFVTYNTVMYIIQSCK